MTRAVEVWMIRLAGRWDDIWAEGVRGGRTDRLPDGTTRFTGRFADQAELVGFLARIVGLGGKLLSVEREESERRD